MQNNLGKHLRAFCRDEEENSIITMIISIHGALWGSESPLIASADSTGITVNVMTVSKGCQVGLHLSSTLHLRPASHGAVSISPIQLLIREVWTTIPTP